MNIGNLRFWFTNSWDRKRKFIRFVDFVLDFDWHIMCITILNFEFEIDWSRAIKKNR